MPDNDEVEGIWKDAIVSPEEEIAEEEDIHVLLNLASHGDDVARRKLTRRLSGSFKAPPTAEPSGVYPSPLNGAVSIDELWASRKYEAGLVRDFVDKVCNPVFLPLGAAMMLFVVMCIKMSPTFDVFGSKLRMKLKQLFGMFDTAHPWVKANILLEMRERLYHEHHLTYCRASVAAARQYDALPDWENQNNGDGENG